jgi:hypothetical protein
MGEPVRVDFGAIVANPGPRIRTCLRCETIADHARQNKQPVPPVNQAQSWLVVGPQDDAVGVRYWGGLCWGCADVERRMRESKRRSNEQQPGYSAR